LTLEKPSFFVFPSFRAFVMNLWSFDISALCADLHFHVFLASPFRDKMVYFVEEARI